MKPSKPNVRRYECCLANGKTKQVWAVSNADARRYCRESKAISVRLAAHFVPNDQGEMPLEAKENL